MCRILKLNGIWYLQNIADYFQDGLKFDCSTWSEIRASTAPQQVGEHDCGIYMCQFAKISLFGSYLDIPPKADVSDMLCWRQMMVLELVSGKIRWV
jgi:Ulp1 family protease